MAEISFEDLVIHDTIQTIHLRNPSKSYKCCAISPKIWTPKHLFPSVSPRHRTDLNVEGIHGRHHLSFLRRKQTVCRFGSFTESLAMS
jgi:hypothetical protein